ncbi:uncharacterized protein LOC132740120 [Ruditapes philippinarum]|uniref:uncharacterized protein LOC132740120 n=1 Tax=Ruditapes philippinarum TaxID=129788 RepID=UPI00295C2398|nr:uncharacterized protein LOC132740120 [Ruditapes philippinarum]
MVRVMTNCTTQLLFSLSLVYMVSSISSPSSSVKSEKSRNKRSLLLDNLLRHRVRWMKPYKDTSKRNAFDELDFDQLLNDPIFQDMGTGDYDFNEMDMNTFPDYSDDAPYEKDDFSNIPELNDLPPIEKDEMSNVIPGAKGPFDFPTKQNSLDYHNHDIFGNSEKLPAFTESVHMYNVAETLMDEFMQFIDMKNMGLLDKCLKNKSKR